MMMKRPELPKSAKSIKGFKSIAKLWRDIFKRFTAALKNRRKSEDPAAVSDNYKGSWGNVLQKREWKNYSSLEEFLNPHAKKNIFATLNHKWMVVNKHDFLKFRAQSLRSMIERFLPADSDKHLVIEAGCGWGRNLFCLRAQGYKGPLKGYELTEEAVQAAREIADHFKVKNISFEQIDLITDIIPDKNAVIYTYHCMEQIKYNTQEVLSQLASANPICVIHFEPVPELFKIWRLRDVIYYLYNKAADYQCSILSTLKHMEAKRKVELRFAERQGYYQLPVQETICVVWRPV